VRLLRLARRTQPNPTRRRLFPRNPPYNSRPTLTLDLESPQRATDANALARLRVESPHDPGARGGDLDGRLAGLHLAEELIQLDHVERHLAAQVEHHQRHPTTDRC
jgi:hypothetical protein